MDPIKEIKKPQVANQNIQAIAAALTPEALRDLMLSFAQKAYIKYYEYRFIPCSSLHSESHEMLISYRNSFAILYQQWKKNFSGETKAQALELLNIIPETFDIDKYLGKLNDSLDEQQTFSPRP